MKKKIYEITDVTVIYTLKNPPQILVSANGLTRSTGCTDGELILQNKAMPEDGIFKFDFVATPPNGPSNPALTPIHASYVLGEVTIPFRGAMVCSETNCITKYVEEKELVS